MVYYSQDGSYLKKFNGSQCYYFNAYQAPGTDFTILKTDTLYNIIWAKSFSPEARLIAVGEDESLYLMNDDTSLVRADLAGNVLWTKKFATPAFSKSVFNLNLSRNTLVNAFPFGDKILVSLFQKEILQPNWGYSSVVALDTSGNFLWAVGDSIRPFGVSGIHKSIDGGFWLSGSVSTTSASWKSAGVVRISGNGDVYFRRLLQTLFSNGNVLSINALPDSTYFILTNSYTLGGEAINLIRLRNDGESVWNYVPTLDTNVYSHSGAYSSAMDENNKLYFMASFGFVNGFVRIDSLCNIDSAPGWNGWQPYSIQQNALTFKNGFFQQTWRHSSINSSYTIFETMDSLGNNLCFPTDTILNVYKLIIQTLAFQNDTTWCPITYVPVNVNTTAMSINANSFGDFCSYLNVPQSYEPPVMTIYPNPVTNGKIEINFYSDHVSMCNLSINDMTGRLLMQHSLNITSGSNNLKVQTNKLTAGIYFVTMNLNGRNFISKIIIQ